MTLLAIFFLVIVFLTFRVIIHGETENLNSKAVGYLLLIFGMIFLIVCKV